MSRHAELDPAVDGDYATRLVAEKEKRKNLYREARQDRIKAGKPEWSDCQEEEEIVCPHCGVWHQHLLTSPTTECLPGATNVPHELRVQCDTCKEFFGLTVRYLVRYTSEKLEPCEHCGGTGKETLDTTTLNDTEERILFQPCPVCEGRGVAL